MSISLVHFIVNNKSSALIGYWRQTSKFHCLEIRHLRSCHCSRHQLARTNIPSVYLPLDVQKWTSIDACVEHLFWYEGSFGFLLMSPWWEDLGGHFMTFILSISFEVIRKFSWTKRDTSWRLHRDGRTSERFNKSIPFALPKNTWH